MSLNTIINLSSDDIVLSINVPNEASPPLVVPSIASSVSPPVTPPVLVEEIPSISNTPHATVESPSNPVQVHVEPLDERPPALKKSRGSTEFTTSFSKSYKHFDDLAERQKKNITKPLIEMLNKFIEINQFSMSVTDLLDYLKYREKERNEEHNTYSK